MHRQSEIVPVSACVGGDQCVVAQHNGGALGEIRKSPGNGLSGSVIEKDECHSGRQPMTADISQSYLRAGVNGYAFGGDLIREAGGARAADFAFIGAVGLKRQAPLRSDASDPLCSRADDRPAARSVADPDRAGYPALAAEDAAIYLHGTGAGRGTALVCERQDPVGDGRAPGVGSRRSK